MKHNTQYLYEYPDSRETLFEKLNDQSGQFHNWHRGRYMIQIKGDDSFALGIERSGHQGGYWFDAQIEEKDSGGILIRGKIIYESNQTAAPDRKKESWIHYIFYCLVLIVLLPIVLAAWLLVSIYNLVNNILNHRKICFTQKQKLDYFMLDYLNCQEIK